MLRIVIYSDDKYIRDHLQSICEKFLTSKKIIATISGFFAIEFFENRINIQADISFLGVSIKGSEGLFEQMIVLRNQYISQTESWSQYICGSFHKPISDGEVEKYLKYIIRTACIEKELDLSNDYDCSVNSKEIKYIMEEYIYSKIYSEKGKFLLRKTLYKWEEELEDCDFFRINRSCIINLAFIQSILGKKVFVDGQEFTVSKQKYEKFLKRYQQYYRKIRG